MDGYKLFKQIIKLSKFNITVHNKNPLSIYSLNTYLIILNFSVEKNFGNFGNSIGINLVFLFITYC